MKSVRIVNIIIALSVWLFPLQVSGQEANRNPAPDQKTESIRIDTSLVLVDGIVINKKTKAIVGDLGQNDFSIFENGRKQEITHFSREELPLSVVLLMDVSGSVQPIIEEIRKAALDALGNLKPKDRAATMIFANSTKLITGLTTDHTAVSEGIDDIWTSVHEVGYGTLITRAVYDAARYLRRSTNPTERRAIILITDDEDYRYSVPPKEVVLRELYEGGTSLCGIMVSHGKAARTALSIGSTAAITAANPILGGVLLGMKILRKASSPGSTTRFLSENTGGVSVDSNKEEIGRVFVEMMQMLRTRYTFGYEPPEEPANGQLRQLKLTVIDEVMKKRKGDIAVFARRGYYYRKPGSSRQTGLLQLKRTEEPEPDPPLVTTPAVPVETAELKPENYPQPRDFNSTELGLPDLNRVNKITLSPAFGCRPDGAAAEGYHGSALFLSNYTNQRNIPDLLFTGSCGSPSFFVVSTSSDDMSLVADLGDVPIEDLVPGPNVNLSQVPGAGIETRFTRSAVVNFNHTYLVLINRPGMRGTFVFRVVGFIPDERVDIVYAVKSYQVVPGN